MFPVGLAYTKTSVDGAVTTAPALAGNSQCNPTSGVIDTEVGRANASLSGARPGASSPAVRQVPAVGWPVRAWVGHVNPTPSVETTPASPEVSATYRVPGQSKHTPKPRPAVRDFINWGRDAGAERPPRRYRGDMEEERESRRLMRADTQDRARQRGRKHEYQLAYLQAGGEWDPGPPMEPEPAPAPLIEEPPARAPPGGGVIKRLARGDPGYAAAQGRSAKPRADVYTMPIPREKRPVTHKHGEYPKRQIQALAQKLSASTAMDAVQASVAAGLAQQAGVDDAKAAQLHEDLMRKLTTKLEEGRGVQARVGELVATTVNRFVGLSWHATNWCDSYLDGFTMVAKDADTLLRPPFPYRWYQLEAAEIRCANQYRLEEEPKPRIVEDVDPLTSPAVAEMGKAPGNYYVIKATLLLRHVGFCGVTKQVEQFECFFSWEQLIAMQSRRIARASLQDTIKAVMSYRSGHPGYPAPDRNFSVNDEVTDQLLAALLLRERASNTQTYALGCEMLTKAAFSGAQARLQRMMGGPNAEGYYLTGYRVQFKDLFPDQWREAQQRVAEGVDPQQAALEMVDKAATKAGSISESKQARAIPADTDRDNGTIRVDKVIADDIPQGGEVQFAGPVLAGAQPVNTMESNFLAALKRIMSGAGQVNVEMRRRWTAVSKWMADQCQRDRPELDVPHWMSEAWEAVKSRKWSAQEKQDFIDGAQYAADMALEPPSTQKSMMDRIISYVCDFGSFKKAEHLDLDELKAPRSIQAQGHFLRGFTWFLFAPGQHTYFQVFGEHSVKGRTAEQSTLEVAEMEIGDGVVPATGDISSCEATVDMDRRRDAAMIMEACSPPQLVYMQRRLEEEYARRGMCFSGGFWVIRVPAMRASGEFITSSGNHMYNVAANFTMITASQDVPIDQTDAWMTDHAMRLQWKIEGDDSLFVLPKKWAKRIAAWYAEMAIKCKSFKFPEVLDGTFCGKRAAYDSEGKAHILVCPVETICKANTLFGANPDSNHADQYLFTAKVLAYATLYGELPVAGPVLRAALWSKQSYVREVNRQIELLTSDQVPELREDDLAGKRARVAAQLYLDMTLRRQVVHRDILGVTARKCVSRVRQLLEEAASYSDGKAFALAHKVDLKLRSAITEMRPGLSDEIQIQLELALIDAYVNKKKLVAVPFLFRACGTSLRACYDMSIRYVADKRAAARSAIEDKWVETAVWRKEKGQLFTNAWSWVQTFWAAFVAPISVLTGASMTFALGMGGLSAWILGPAAIFVGLASILGVHLALMCGVTLFLGVTTPLSWRASFRAGQGVFWVCLGVITFRWALACLGVYRSAEQVRASCKQAAASAGEGARAALEAVRTGMRTAHALFAGVRAFSSH